MILVTGASGSIGRYAVRKLVERRAELRAFVRDHVKGEMLGCDHIVGDFDAPDTVRSALAGVDRVLLNSSVDDAMVPRQKAVINAAKAAGVKQVVRVSAAGASPTSDRVINRWHAELDAHLEASGMAWSLIRPTFFTQNILSSAASIRSDGKLYGGFGSGRLAFVDCADIAECAAVLLTEEIRSGGIFVVTGRETISFAEVAAKLSAALAKPITYIDRSPREIVAAMKARGLSPAVADSFGKMMESFANGGASSITSAVKDLTHHEPHTFDDFLRENLDRFR